MLSFPAMPRYRNREPAPPFALCWSVGNMGVLSGALKLTPTGMA